MNELRLTHAARQRLGLVDVRRRVQVAGSAFYIAAGRGAREINSADVVAAERRT